MLFLPTKKDKAEAENAIREILGTTSGIEPEVYPQIENRDTNSHSTANPYILLAYSTCGTNDIDKIASLDYYTDGELLEVMKSVEDPRGMTIFSGGENGGLGYVDPLYVRNDVIREMRWHPWARGQVEVVDAQRTAEAMFYAMFPGDDKAGGELGRIQAELQGIGWLMPLVRHKSGNRYVLTRLPLELDDAKVQSDHATHRLDGWDVDKPLATLAGLHNVWDALHGNGEGAKRVWRAPDAGGERVVLGCRLATY